MIEFVDGLEKVYHSSPPIVEALGEIKEILKDTSIHGPTREQVEKAFRAHWKDVDSGSGMLSKCSNCGFKALYPNIYVFCPDCGSPFTDVTVDIVMGRLEALKDGTTE